MVDQPGAATANDLQLLAVGDGERRADHLLAEGEEGLRRLRVEAEAFRLQPQEKVRIRADVGPGVPEAVMSYAEEVASLGQQAGDDRSAHQHPGEDRPVLCAGL